MILFLLTNYVVNRYAIPKFQTRPMQGDNQCLLKTAKEKEFDAGHREELVYSYWQAHVCSVLQKKTVM